SFGIQIPDFSLGRLADGSWGLTQPTFGAANVAQPTADPHSIKINEWLASGRTLEVADFLELYNPEPAPANMGGMFLTDAPQGGPARHRIPAFSFINGFGLAVFIADGDASAGADHVNFHLSADQGQIGLFDSGMNLVDCVVYAPQTPDVAEGRRPNGSSVLGKISPPTPGSPNPGLGGDITTTNIIVNVFPMATQWKYHALGQDLGTDWINPAYNDSSWSSGTAYLGNENCNCLPPPVGPQISTVLSLFD